MVLVVVLDVLIVADTVGHALVVFELVIVLVPVTDAVLVLVAVIVAVPVRVVTRLPDWRVDFEYEGEAEDVFEA